ncbi:lipid-A-disaccharide synthase [Lutibaculum baratangense]|uniref:Lipid-A-disaccharide synthase n=1 Tax=Lutibaculum baratangense AMV1 TaxID=631454 RepID=V4RJR0_9HYPH|nr:lipid-A-disaccharide synthase [Lutibaculum baratangense]ESR23475.1 Lipid-A-disaccharide synthase [Lutibaculum baratangense AMV1]
MTGLRIAVIAGEESGDLLGAGLMAALRRSEPDVSFIGVGGRHMEAEGLRSLFPLDEIAVMGPVAIARALRPLLRRIRQAAGDVIAARPDALVIIDSPEFTHRVAKRIRKALPALPIINYSPPTVWAWRSGRARAMRFYVDRAMALLPFEPAAYSRLGGPPCDYVGHPVVEAAKRHLAADLPAEATDADPLLVVLPGSRRSEISRLLGPFAATVARLAAAGHRFRVAMPAVGHLVEELHAATRAWPVPVEIVEGEEQKWLAFRRARAALAASGTVTLQLAIADVPMVVGYKVEPAVAWLAPVFRRLFPMRSVVMANLILDENVVPEFIEEPCTPENLSSALALILGEGRERRKQIEGFSEIRRRMQMDGATPSERAAEIVLETARRASAERGVGAS